MIIDLLKNKTTTISFEIFPPKKTTGFETINETIASLSNLEPDFISVTYGAGGGTSQNTVKIAKEVQERYKKTALAHLTCVSSTKEEIKEIVSKLKENNIKNILAMRGDIPKDEGYKSPNHYKFAYELIGELKESGDFCIGGACYPEGHLESYSLDQDIENLKKKVDSGCEFLITQLFFDNEMLYRFMNKISKKGINIPIIAGVMPIQNRKQVERMCKLSGASIPPKFRTIIEKYEYNEESLGQAGIAYVTDQIVDLYANEINGLHIYTMNKPEVANKIVQNISYLKK